MSVCLFALTLALAPMQDPVDAPTTAKQIYEAVLAAGNSIERPTERTREAATQYGKLRTEVISKAADEAFAAHPDLFASGDGLHYKGLILAQLRRTDEARQAFLEHIKTAASTDLANASMLQVASASMYSDSDLALEFADKIDRGKLDDQAGRMFDSLQRWATGTKLRNGLNGQPAPAWTAEHVIGGDADLSLESCKGKVTLIDFWATWCPPCRQVIPDLVKLQEHYGDKVQVLGLTRFYGYGSDFSDPEAQLPHGGKTVGSRNEPMPEEQELKVNEVFAKAFHLNYPIVFVGKEIASEKYGVQGIPTLFVIDKNGAVVGHFVGAGADTHARLEAMIDQALGAPAEASTRKAHDGGR